MRSQFSPVATVLIVKCTPHTSKGDRNIIQIEKVRSPIDAFLGSIARYAYTRPRERSQQHCMLQATAIAHLYVAAKKIAAGI